MQIKHINHQTYIKAHGYKYFIIKDLLDQINIKYTIVKDGLIISKTNYLNIMINKAKHKYIDKFNCYKSNHELIKNMEQDEILYWIQYYFRTYFINAIQPLYQYEL